MNIDRLGSKIENMTISELKAHNKRLQLRLPKLSPEQVNEVGELLAMIDTCLSKKNGKGRVTFKDRSGGSRQGIRTLDVWWIQARSATFDLNDSLTSIPSSFKIA